MRILKYLDHTKDYGLTLGGRNVDRITCYVDANHAGDTHNCIRSKETGNLIEGGKSITGYIFFLGNSPVSWKSKKQSRATATSSTEPEVIALTAATKEARWMGRLCSEMMSNPAYERGIIIREDNTSCISVVTKGQVTERSKHFNLDFFYVTEQIELGNIKVVYCETSDMVADIFTKPLHGPQFHKLRRRFVSGMDPEPEAMVLATLAREGKAAAKRARRSAKKAAKRARAAKKIARLKKSC